MVIFAYSYNHLENIVLLNMENRVVLLLGGNLDDRVGLLKDAKNLIAQRLGPVICASSIYESEPWGFEYMVPPFLNQVIIISSVSNPLQVLQKTQQIERDLGRKKTNTAHYMSRLIDIDILFFNEECISSTTLHIPHIEIANRRFVLIPLNEIISDYTHPVINKKISELLFECEDTGSVALYVRN